MKYRQALAKLRKAGVEVTNQRSRKHVILRYDQQFAIFPRGAYDLGLAFLKRTCKQLGLDYKKVFGTLKEPLTKDTPKIPVRIYVSDPDASTTKKVRIRKSVNDIIADQDFVFTNEIADEEGSWWNELLYSAKKKLSEKDVQDRFTKAERAIQVYLLDKHQADADKSEAEAVAALINSLEGVSEACIQAGSLLVVKSTNSSGKVVIISRSLTPLEMSYIEKNISMLKNPKEILDWIQGQDRKKNQPIQLAKNNLNV